MESTAATTALEPSRSLGSRLAAVARRAGYDLAYLTLTGLSAILGFTVLVTGVSVTASLIVFIVGIFVGLATAYAFRAVTLLDRRLAKLAIGETIQASYVRVPVDAGWLDRVKLVARDRQTWRDTAWLTVHSVTGFTFGVAAVTAVATVLGLILMPAWYWAMPDSDPVTFGIFDADSLGFAFLATGIGIALVPLLLLLLRGMTLAEGNLARALLSPSRSEALERRVSELRETRTDLAEAARSELERIERDLHDGAQARIVALAMDLGMAQEAVARDPEAARELVSRAHGEALTALAELRDLARGLRPALLAERGLPAAVEGLASRSPLTVRTQLSGDLDDLPQPVESAAYFVVAEALANAAKHSGGSNIDLRLTRLENALEIDVEDDGRGGADPTGSGLTGLRARVAALDGILAVESPTGGPTIVRARIPCG